MVPGPRPPSPAERAVAAPVAPAPRPRRPLVTFATALVLCCAAGLPLLRLLGRPGLHVLALAVLPAGVAAAATRTGASRLSRNPGSPFPVLAGFLAGIVAGALPGLLLAAADPFGPAALAPRLVDAVRDGWRRLLSVPVPVPDTRSFTDLPVLLIAVLATVVMLMALSDRPAVALVPATVGFGGLLALGVDGPGSAVLLAGCYVAAVVLFLLFGGRPPATARPGAAAVCVVAAVAAAIAAVTVVHTGPPYDPRNTLRIPLNISVLQDPLALLPARLETPRQRVLTAELPGALALRPPPWVALAYEDYDGAGWQVAGTARPAAAVLPAPGRTATGSVAVTLAGPGLLLPHPSPVTATAPEDLGYDPDADMIVSPRAIGRYSVTVSGTAPSAAALRDAATPSVAAVLGHVPSCTPAAVRQLAAQAAQGSGGPYDRAVRLQQLLKAAPFRYLKAAPPGEGCGSIGRFLSSHRGTSSQFATVFALAARLMGMPARVAAGYLPGSLAGHTETVTDADAYAWPQVLFSGTGWVNFYPVPRAGTAVAPRVRQRHVRLHKLKVSTPGSHSGKKGAPPRTAARHLAAGHPGTPLWLLLAVAVGVLLLAWPTVVFLASASRRGRRRRAREPAACVLGAWDELLIPLREAGVQVHGRSAPRVAKAAVAVIPGEERTVGQLAVLAERALYDVTREPDADTAWQLSDRARAAAARAAGRRARVRRLFLPSRRRP
jgi:hypothetical protein